MKLAVLLFAAALMQTAPNPNHGPYADRDGWICYKGETVETAKRVHCACKEKCENDGLEDHACQTYCASQKCLCHVDSSHCGHVH